VFGWSSAINDSDSVDTDFAAATSVDDACNHHDSLQVLAPDEEGTIENALDVDLSSEPDTIHTFFTNNLIAFAIQIAALTVVYLSTIVWSHFIVEVSPLGMIISTPIALALSTYLGYKFLSPVPKYNFLSVAVAAALILLIPGLAAGVVSAAFIYFGLSYKMWQMS
jgi:hypothetical protein